MSPDPPKLLHGLCVAGDLRVPGAAQAVGDPDLTVRVGEPGPTEPGAPPGDLVASLGEPGEGYDASLEGSLLCIRFHDAGEFAVGLDTGEVDAWPVPGREGMLAVLMAGNVPAIVLGLRGHGVLHASAVEVDGATIAFCGPPGAGKSTTAALCCAAGAALVCDDMARVAGEDAPNLHRGPAELRLRGAAAGLAERIQGEVRETADGRIGVFARSVPDEVVPLDAFIFPRWSDTRSPTVVGLGQRETLDGLLRSPRVTGWVVPEPLRRHFELSAALADKVPALVLQLPGGRLDDPGLPGEVAEALAAALRATGSDAGR